jgi:transposase
MRHDKMTAPMVLEGAMNAEMFLAYLEQCLCPTLQRNDIVVMDNCRAHMGPRVRELIEKAGATVRYLPKYSPDLIRSRCLTANSRHSCVRLQREAFRLCSEQFARSCRCSMNNSARTTFVMQAMVPYDWELL